MDDRKPKRRRKLSPKEIKALEKQRKKQQELNRKRQKQAAKEREAARKAAMKKGVRIEDKPQRNKEKRPDESRGGEYSRREAERLRSASENRVKVENIEVKGERALGPERADKRGEKRRPDDKKARDKRSKKRNNNRRREKTMPDIIEKETDKRVRNLEATDHKDGFYADEVEVRKAQARKERKKRRKKMPKPISPKQRRIRRIIAYVTIITTVIVVGVVLSLTVLFKAENIYVEGNKYYTEDTIVRLAKVREGDNIFMASMFGDTSAVKDSLPYIKSASIHFRLPNSIVIDVENAKESYSMKADGLYYKVSEENRILEQVSKRPKKLASLVAPELKSKNIGDKVEFKDKSYTKAFDELSQCIKKHNYKKITEINIKRISDISITYDNRIKIKIGLPEAIEYKLKTAFAIINEKLDINKSIKTKGVLDVSKCNKTKKSYFKEGSIKDNEEEILTQPTTTATEETTVRATFIAPETQETTEAYDEQDDNNEDEYDSQNDENYDEENEQEPETEAEE